MDTTLTTFDGYPRDDVDVAQSMLSYTVRLAKCLTHILC
jgi:hypothetical protein